jgi:hypothetical protein
LAGEDQQYWNEIRKVVAEKVKRMLGNLQCGYVVAVAVVLVAVVAVA